MAGSLQAVGLFSPPVATETSFSSSTFSPTTPTLRASVWSSSSAALHSPKQIQAAKTATLFSISYPISSKTPPFNSDITSYRSTQRPTTILRGNFQTDLSRSFSRVRVVEKNLVPVTIRANQVNFKAKREIKIPFREGACAANDYLKETERVVQVTFPDSSRIEYMGDKKWRSRLRPIIFFSISATPIVEMRVSFEEGVLCLQSDKLVLDFTGVPDDFAVQDFQFALNGNLRVIPRAVQVKQARPICDFAGSVSLGLGTNLPLAFSLIPEGIVTRVGDEILDRIIGAMEGALLKGIISDYNDWCRLKSKKSRSASPQPAPLRTSRS